MELVVEKIFEASAIYDEKVAPFYYDCDGDLSKKELPKELPVKKNDSLKAVEKKHRVNLMNHIAQKKGIPVRYSSVGDLILVEHSTETISTHHQPVEFIEIIKNNLARAATFVYPPCYYARKEFTKDGCNTRCWNVVLENLDLFSEKDRNQIIEIYKSLLPGNTITWENNILSLV
jgi:predicted HAD superfamily phosphohydrolase